MFDFFRKRRIADYTDRARKYLSKVLVGNESKETAATGQGVNPKLNSAVIPPERKNLGSLRGNDVPKNENGGHNHSSQIGVKHNVRGGAKYSLKRGNLLDPNYGKRNKDASCGDNYNFSAVSQVMRNYNSGNDMTMLSKELDHVTDKTFVDIVAAYINDRKIRDADVYKAAQIDRRLFSKIMSDRKYKPSKDTALAIALSLKLNFNETLDLLSRAGYTLSHSNKRDVLIEYFLREKIYRIDDVNMVLYNLGEKIIGR